MMKKIIGITAITFLIVAIAVPVLAHGPGGNRGNMMSERDRGPGMRPGWEKGTANGPSFGNAYSSLTTEQRDQLDAIYKKYYDETEQTRNDLQVKRAELNAALNSSTPDAEKAKAIQKEISALQADLAQKRIDLQIEVRKIIPDTAYGPGFGRSFGSRMMGNGYPAPGGMRGGFSPGTCWN